MARYADCRSYEAVCHAGVAELADARDLGSRGETHAGSIPVARIDGVGER
jgi:hypothetical protein